MTKENPRWRRPWESILKIAITLGYALGEVRNIIVIVLGRKKITSTSAIILTIYDQFLTGWWAEYTFLLHAQHITMCGFFLLNGIVDILVFKKVI